MKKKDLLIPFITLAVYLFSIFYSVNFDLQEFKIAIKASIGQELTLEEMKSTRIYKAYNQIDDDTSIEEINSILNKKNKNSYGLFDSWYYPYGYLSVWRVKEEQQEEFTKIVSFKTPFTIKLTEEELHTVFECNSLETLTDTFGEPVMLSKTYDNDGEVTEYNYTWRIKTRLTEEFTDEIEKKYGEYVSLPLIYGHSVDFLKLPKKYRLSVLINSDNNIESFSLDKYKW